MAEQTPRTLVSLVGATVAAHPDRTAVSDAQTSLTYAELDARSTELAARLVAAGVRPGDRVGIYLRRSVHVVTTLLGILKAGGAYVAIDDRYPDARRDMMVRLSGAVLVVSEPGFIERLDHLAVRGVPLTTTDPAPSGTTLPEPAAGDAAAILFTSGSSGEPKGTILEHRNLVWLADNPALPRVLPSDRSGQISSLSFDAFHLEMWPTLAAGAELVVLPDVPDLLAAGMREQLTRHGITVLVTPTMVANQAAVAEPGAFAPLRVLQAGGDVLLPSACRAILEADFSGDVYNLYGPTETSTTCIGHRVVAADLDRDSVPIGRPLHDTLVRLVGEDGAEVATGEIGEIFVSGPGVARGYLDKPELTAERFPTDEHGRSWYRTGDLARELPDGDLDFVGRADTQVKIRGYRVELGEVEQSLRRHPAVRDALVMVTGAGSDRALVAFVAVDPGTSAADVEAFASAELPAFMVPGQVVALPELPANDHGKRDQEAMRAHLEGLRQRSGRAAQPDTETERYLAAVWSELLGVEEVGRDGDFYALGGHSMLGFQLRARIRRDRGVTVGLKELLATPELSGMAALIDDAGSGADLL